MPLNIDEGEWTAEGRSRLYKAVRRMDWYGDEIARKNGAETHGPSGISYGSSLGGIQREVSAQLFLNIHKRNFSLGQKDSTTY